MGLRKNLGYPFAARAERLAQQSGSPNLCLSIQTIRNDYYNHALIRSRQLLDTHLVPDSLPYGLLANKGQWQIDPVQCHPIDVPLPPGPIPECVGVTKSADIVHVAKLISSSDSEVNLCWQIFGYFCGKWMTKYLDMTLKIWEELLWWFCIMYIKYMMPVSPDV